MLGGGDKGIICIVDGKRRSGAGCLFNQGNGSGIGRVSAVQAMRHAPVRAGKFHRNDLNGDGISIAAAFHV